MARPILHHGGVFVHWTTVADGPITTGLDREEMIRHLVARNDRPMPLILEAMEAATAYGTSFVDDDDLPEKDMTAMDVLHCNQAGSGGSCIEAEELHRLLFVERAPLERIRTILGTMPGDEDEA